MCVCVCVCVCVSGSRFNGGSDPVLMDTTVFSDDAHDTGHEERGQCRSSVMVA